MSCWQSKIGVEDFPDGKRRGRMPANEPETFLQFGGRRIFEPEHVIRLELFAEPRRFDRRQAMMRVVQ